MSEINESQIAGNAVEPEETLESLREQLNAAQQTAAEWRQKYEQAESARYNEKLDAFVERQRPRNDLYAAKLKQELTERNLQFNDAGELVGSEEVIAEMSKKYHDAFLPNPDERVAAPTSGHVPQMAPDLFGASFKASTAFPEKARPSKNEEW